MNKNQSLDTLFANFLEVVDNFGEYARVEQSHSNFDAEDKESVNETINDYSIELLDFLRYINRYERRSYI